MQINDESDLEWSGKNTLVLFTGLLFLAAGFIFLALAKRDISSLFGVLSPFLIIIGYVVVILSVLISSKKSAGTKNDN